MSWSYRIQIKGRIGPEMSHLLADLDPTTRTEGTVFTTDTTDQAELHGVLARLRNLGLEIESIGRTESGLSDT